MGYLQVMWNTVVVWLMIVISEGLLAQHSPHGNRDDVNLFAQEVNIDRSSKD